MKLQTLKSGLPTLRSTLPRLKAGPAGAWRTGKESSTARGYGYKWQKAREEHLEAHPLCVMCEADGQPTAATVVDHKIPHRGDQKLFWDRKNWQSLCTPCHSGRKQRDEAAGRT
ncbi:MAG: HNH endonuclease signature motif containing protein [Pseudomonadota bacterium]